jgi:hypothetical protein
MLPEIRITLIFAALETKKQAHQNLPGMPDTAERPEIRRFVIIMTNITLT